MCAYIYEKFSLKGSFLSRETSALFYLIFPLWAECGDSGIVGGTRFVVLILKLLFREDFPNLHKRILTSPPPLPSPHPLQHWLGTGEGRTNIDFNPNSHGVFFVSRLTAVGHMRHPCKADLGEKWRRFSCLCVRLSARTSPARLIQKQSKRDGIPRFSL